MSPLGPDLLARSTGTDAPMAILHAGGEEVAMIAIIMGTLSAVAFPLVRALARRLDSKTALRDGLSGVEEQRMERMERAIDSIAIEVERISEAQRFTTKLLAERASTSPAERPPSPPGERAP
ncbi:MAG: hypothetical protein FJ363_11360 [Gemmatimonadetes bacterium]|nr:hypothetical protein [Gemmatimonadota bacterium]